MDEAMTKRAGLALPVSLVLIAGVGLAAYWNSFDVPFQWDDGQAIVENARVQDLGAFFRAPFEPARWIAFLSFAVDGSLHGQRIFGLHLVNLAIHLATALLVFAMARFVVRAATPGAPESSPLAEGAALLTALLFVAHPIQTQAVTYIVQRMASLAALFYVAAVVLYAHANRPASAARRRGLMGAALAVTVLALLTKQNAATLPLALLLFDACFLDGTWRERAARLWPFWAVAAVLVAALLNPVSGAGSSAIHFGQEAGVSDVPAWWSYALTQTTVVVEYLRLLVVPVGQNIDHDVPAQTSLFAAPVLRSLGILALTLAVPAAAAWRARASGLGRIVLFGVGWFVVALAVESSVLPIADVIMEHRVYLPSVGPFLLVASLAAWGAERWRAWKVVGAAAGVAIVALAVATHERNELWRDPMALWSDTVRKSPMKSRPYTWVAKLLVDRGDEQGAIAVLERAAALPGAQATVQVGLGIGYRKLGRVAEAERAFQRAFALGGVPVRGAHRLYGELMLQAGRVGEACEQFAAELKVDPSNRDARLNDASCRAARGDLAGAVSSWRALALEAPDDAPTLFNLANGLARMGDDAGAGAAFRRFLMVAGDAHGPQRAASERWLREHGAP